MKVWNVYYEMQATWSTGEFIQKKISFKSENGAYRFAKAIRQDKDYIIRNVIVKEEIDKKFGDFGRVIKEMHDGFEKLEKIINNMKSKPIDVEQEINSLEEWMNK